MISKPQDYLEIYVEPGTTLFRVHQAPLKFPGREEFDDLEVHAISSISAKNNSISAGIEFHNHWVSFTDDPKAITSPYFLERGLIGDVIVLKSDKAIRLDPIGGLKLTFEQEVVAPLDETNVIEVWIIKVLGENI